MLEGELNLNVNGEATVVAAGDSYQVKAGVVMPPHQMAIFAAT